MGLDNTTPKMYYDGNNYGNYQFTSLDDIINQFMVVYVGDQKIINKASRIDVAFHAQRALAELSFDTFKSIKTQEITLPSSLTMVLPHDYVNYTKLLYSDSAGITHPIYPTKHTQNSFTIKRHEDGRYYFGEEFEAVVNGNFDTTLTNGWTHSDPGASHAWNGIRQTSSTPPKYFVIPVNDTISIVNEELEFGQLWNNGYGVRGGSKSYGAWQSVDVQYVESMDLTAVGTSSDRLMDGSTIICEYGEIRIGITSTNPEIGWEHAGSYSGLVTGYDKQPYSTSKPSPNFLASNIDLGYVEWSDGSSSKKELENINVGAYSEVWIYIQSFQPWQSDGVTDANQLLITNTITPTSATYITSQKNTIDSISVIVPGNIQTLSNANVNGNSTTWDNYKSTTPSENNTDDYTDDTYWPVKGERYGLDPQHSQVNGSFYIDELRGLIHFSSNLSGSTIILNYLSDSLGTDGEMQVHKFAEEAMYKCIIHAILSTSSYGQALVPRLTKEKFAAIRKAKLRLSNIKLEELTQILRGKSKHIKH